MHPLILLLLLTGTPAATRQPEPASAFSAPVAPQGPTRGESAAVASLRADLDRLIANSGMRGARWGILVVSLTRGDTLYARDADESFVPASNAKLFTTAAAFYYLGSEFRLNTFLLADGPIEDGVLRGDLVLYGTGDPTFTERFGGRSRAFEAFADTLVSRGVSRVAGDVVGDASYFRGGPSPGWQTNYIDASYAAPASALSFAENIATLRVQPGPQPGWRPEVTLLPGGEGIAIVNQATTIASGRISIRVSRDEYDGPLLISGRIPRSSRGVTRSLPVSDPAIYAAAAFREILASRGITAEGVRSVSRPEDSPVTGRSVFAPAFDRTTPMRVLAVHNSPPLIEILTVVNKRSHNLFAEQTFRTVGRVATGDGSVLGGARAVQHLMARETGIDTAVVRLFDGSGLSVLDRVSARAVIHLLAYAARSPFRDAFRSTLPEAGAEDGLRRMQRTAAEHNLVAKTGTLSNVSALSGYVTSRDGELLAFSVLSNAVSSTWRAKRVEDGIGARLASFQRTEPPADAGARVEATDPSPRYYTIRRGDTLESIARSHGTTVSALRAANPGLEPRRLLPGTRISLPDR